MAIAGEQTLRSPGFLQKGVRGVLVSRKSPVALKRIRMGIFYFLGGGGGFVTEKYTTISWFGLKGVFFVHFCHVYSVVPVEIL